MKPNESAFLEFGLLPEVCIHTVIQDQYSKMYTPREFCDCGCSEWIVGYMDVIRDMMGFKYPKKKVHRCKQCNEVRMADHISIVDNQGES